MHLSIWRNIARTTKFALKQNARSFASADKLVDLQVNDKTGIATVTMQRPPVNSLNLELISSLQATLSDLESNKCRGAILTSASPTVFSAGLDIMEMYKPNPDRLKNFWTALQDLWLTLYGATYPTAAAINGHSPAGGCLLACCCEYRIMVQGNFTIGLNETKLGIVAPFWFMDSFKNVLPARTAELALTSGKLFTVDEALKSGLIDEVASDKNDALAKAEKFFALFAKIHPFARGTTKLQLRRAALQRLEDQREDDLENFLNFATMPEVQKGLGLYIESLKKK